MSVGATTVPSCLGLSWWRKSSWTISRPQSWRVRMVTADDKSSACDSIIMIKVSRRRPSRPTRTCICRTSTRVFLYPQIWSISHVVSGGWGRQGITGVELRSLTKNIPHRNSSHWNIPFLAKIIPMKQYYGEEQIREVSGSEKILSFCSPTRSGLQKRRTLLK